MSAPTNGLGILDYWVDVASADGSGQYPPPDGIIPARVRAAYGWDGYKWWPISRWQYQLGSVRVWEDRFGGYCFVYSAPFVLPTAFDDDVVTDLGLTETMLDIPVLGAAAMLASGFESRRANLGAQGDTRRANEVQAGANLGMAREWIRMRDERIADEYGRLLNAATIAGVTL
jgi:hypothetical protein